METPELPQNMQNPDSLKELSDERKKLASHVIAGIVAFQQSTGLDINKLEVKMINTPNGPMQALDIDVDTFGDNKPTPKSNIVVPSSPLKVH